MRGYRCHKALYLTIQRLDLEPPITPELQALFDQGNQIGELARTYYPGGVLVDFPAWEFVNSLKRTRELIAAGSEVIYEAAFEYKGCYARVDIIKLSKETQRWTMLEAKSTTRVKDEHIDDVGLQAWIVANSGLPVEKIALLHLNPECRFPNLKNLFVEADLTEMLREKYRQTAPRLTAIFEALRDPHEPEIDIGPHCTTNRDCEFKNYCFQQRGLPEISVLDVYVLKNKWDLYAQGKIQLQDLDTAEMTAIQQRMIQSHLSGQRIMELEAIREGVKDWKFPMVFLDFETVGHAVPRYEGCGPYNQVPFQFSVHVLDSLEATPRHFYFLHDQDTDPRPALIPELLKACQGPGSIIAYNKKFEVGVIERLAEVFPADADALLQLVPRFADPLPLIRETIYDPAFRGGFGLKKVAPALLGEKYSYAELSVDDGGAAQRAYAQYVSGQLSPEARKVVEKSILDYCAQDTLAAMELVKFIMKLG